MAIDWPKIEATIFSLASDDIRKFAAKHTDEVFYGFFMDCNSIHGDVLLHMNTPDKLRQGVEAARNKNPEYYANMSVEELEDKWRWEAGDWGYFEINTWDIWKHKWWPIAKQIERYIEEDMSAAETFMRSACRVLLKLESAGLFKLFRATDYFAIWCADHDESLQDAKKRLDAVRGGICGS